MKQRNGFVSNSSSASFAIHWRMRDFGVRHQLEDVIGKVFGYTWKQVHEGDWKCAREHEVLFDIVEKHTQVNPDGTFTTEFWTSMLNNPMDFGTEAMAFVMALLVNNDKLEIIDTKTDYNGW